MGGWGCNQVLLVLGTGFGLGDVADELGVADDTGLNLEGRVALWKWNGLDLPLWSSCEEEV